MSEPTYLFDQHGACAPGDEPTTAESGTSTITKLVTDEEFAKDLRAKIEAALIEHVCPLFDAASKRSMVVTWDSFNPSMQHQCKFRPINVRLVKTVVYD
jgi:hypothetical protein